jgi:hypothetical protein
MTEHTKQAHPNGDEAHPNSAQTKVTVAEAAQLLGLSAEAVRSRVQRGTLKSTKERGTVYVLLDVVDQTRPNTDESSAQAGIQTHLSGDQTDYIASLEGQIDWLRREVERKDTLLMTLMQRIPELEAPRDTASDAREAPVTPSEERGNNRGRGRPEEGESQKPSWWKRFLGVEQ